ncbi:MAG: O-antigen polymerase [Clostridium butyricum]|nr:O-antigen polymerase [Clostridium butyricum]
MVYLLLLSLILIFSINYILVNRDFCAPSNLFCLSFLVCSFFTTLFSKKWAVTLDIKTYGVIVCGVIVFCITSFFISVLFRRANDRWTISINCPIKKYKLVFLLIFQLISYFLIFMNEKQLAFQYGVANSDSISDIIYGFRTLVLNGQADLNPIISLMRRICNTSAYIWGFLIAEKIINKIKYEDSIVVLIYINFIVSLLGNMLDGQRGNTIAIILCTIMMAYILWSRKCKFINKIKLKVIFKLFLAISIILLMFQSVGTLLGRIDYGNSLLDEVGVYLGSEIINLNTIIESGFKTNNLFGVLTFNGVYSFFGVSLDGIDITAFQYTSNGYQLGNVYTVFKDYLLDFGYVGYVFPICFIAIFSTVLYLKIKCKFNYRNIDVSLIILSQVLFAVVFSFFSNKFGEIIFSNTYVSFIIAVILLKIYLYDIFFDKNKLIVKMPKIK